MQREIKSIHLQLTFEAPEVSESSSSLVSPTLGLYSSCAPRSEVGPLILSLPSPPVPFSDANVLTF